MSNGKPAVRCQAVILKCDHMLLLKVWDHKFTGNLFWVIPGGGRVPGETEEECVKREVQEETHLVIEIDRLLLDEPELPEDMYQHAKTYLCRIYGGDLQPGLEPEIDTPQLVTIQDVGWFDLRDPETWDPLALSDPILLYKLHRFRKVLGYETEVSR